MKYFARRKSDFRYSVLGFPLEAPIEIVYTRTRSDSDYPTWGWQIEVDSIEIGEIFIENDDGDRSFCIEKSLPPEIREKFEKQANEFAEQSLVFTGSLPWEEYETA